MSKVLCKLVKDDVLKDDLKSYRKLVQDPTHICLKCGRVANDKKVLCKSEKLKKDKNE